MTNDVTRRAPLDRRAFLAAGAGGVAVAFAGGPRAFAQAAGKPVLEVGTRTIEVNKKAATVFRVAGANGSSGLIFNEGDRLSGRLLNSTADPLQMHWHGQVKAPFEQDRARPGGGMLAPSAADVHDFELTPGTHWMHSHTLSEQRLLAAPMVTREKDAGDVQDVVMMLHDFAFRAPEEILAELGGGNAHGGHGAASAAPAADPHAGHGSGQGAAASDPHAGHRAGGQMQMQPGAGGHVMPGMGMGGGRMMGGMVHANDVRYDAYLANDRAFDDPETVKVEKGGRVRLRVINGGTATSFFISTPGLTSRAIAVDGNPCQPIAAEAYPLAQGQRLDLLVEIPSGGGAFPVLAQVEDERFVTGIVLATAGASVAKLASLADQKRGMIDISFEARLTATKPMAAKRADKAFAVMLGEEPGYRWTINGKTHGEHSALEVRQGERVELTFMNPTMMMHPMHIHGHHFQVVGIGRQRFSGAVRDTVIVPAHMPITVAFDATNKGSWFLHCHHLYHMATGMMTEVRVA